MELSLADFVTGVLLGSFALVPILAMGSRYLHHRVEKQALANRVICRLCLHAFEDSGHVRLVHCPVCNAANEKGSKIKIG